MKHRLWLCALLTAFVAPAFAAAENAHPATSHPVPGIVQDQDQDQDQGKPIQIDAATLEVRDKKKEATFSGDVVVVQGDTTIKCPTLVVFYGKEVGIAGAAPGTTAPKPSSPVPTSAQDIRKIEARGGVTVLTKDQKAIGDFGVYDLQAKTITLTGNVVVSQGDDVVHGDRVVVDTVTGNAHVESMNGGGAAPSRVRALIQPKGQNGGGNLMTFGPSRTN
jgi:lipopolysaccharide export system protein LptA